MNTIKQLKKFLKKYPDINVNNQFIYHWHLFETNVIRAWTEFGFGGKNIKIAVIDYEFDKDIPDFKSKTVAVYDDTMPDSMLSNLTDSNHGNAVASVAAASLDGKGIVGVAPNAKLLLIRSFVGSDSDWFNAFDFAIEKKADIIISSLGYLHGLPISEEMDEKLYEYGSKAVICLASGNSGQETFEMSIELKIRNTVFNTNIEEFPLHITFYQVSYPQL